MENLMLTSITKTRSITKAEVQLANFYLKNDVLNIEVDY
jgi:hypothetical protein